MASADRASAADPCRIVDVAGRSSPDCSTRVQPYRGSAGKNHGQKQLGPDGPRGAVGWDYELLQFLIIRTLALLTRFRGAKRGANDYRHGAMPGHIQPLSPRRNGTSGHTRHRPGTLRKCLLSSRSRVRVAVGAQVGKLFLISYSITLAERGAKRLNGSPRRSSESVKKISLAKDDGLTFLAAVRES